MVGGGGEGCAAIVLVCGIVNSEACAYSCYLTVPFSKLPSTPLSTAVGLDPWPTTATALATWW